MTLLRVSVVICSIRPRALSRALQALRQQRYRDFEVIVVEGPPVDSTEPASGLPPDVRRETCTEANVSRARNIGLTAASGEIVAFLDDDTIPESGWLAQLLAPYGEEHVTGTGGIVLDRSGRWLQFGYALGDRLGRVRFDQQPPFREQSSAGADPFLFLPGCNMSFRRESLLAIGGFDEEFAYGHDDVDVCLRLIDRGALLRALPDAAVHHHHMASGVRRADDLPSDPFLLMKSITYFAISHGLMTYSVEQVEIAIEQQAETLRSTAHAALRNGSITVSERNRFLARVTQGAIAGRERALSAKPARQIPQPSRTPVFRAYRSSQGERPPLRICMFAPGESSTDIGGVLRVAEETSRALAALGHEVHVITHSEGERHVDFGDGVWWHRIEIADRRLPGLCGKSIDMELYAAAAKYREVRRLHARTPIDLVVAPLWMGEGLICLLDPQLATATRLVTSMKTILGLEEAPSEDPRAAALVRLEHAVLERSRHIQAASRAVCLDTETAFGLTLPKAHLAPLGTADRTGVEPERHASLSEIEVLFVGRLEPRKGVDVLLAAARRIVRERSDVVFVIAGPDNPSVGDYGERMRDLLARDPILIDRVRMLGEVKDEQLWRLYAGADVFCAPSRYESYGNVLVEALMFGKPLVACNAGGMPEVVEDGGNGLLAAPGDADSLSKCLGRLIGDRPLRETFGLRSRELYEQRHAVVRMAERTADAYGEMVDAHRANYVAEAADPSGGCDSGGNASNPPATLVANLSRVLVEVGGLTFEDAKEVSLELLSEPGGPFDFLSETMAAWQEDDGRFVRAMYRAILSRYPKPDDIGRWGTYLASGGSRFDLISELVEAKEARNRGVPAGLLDDVLAGHRSAIKTRAIAAWTLPDAEFLRALHLAVLWRIPGPRWLADNTRILKEGASRSSVARALTESPEAQTRGMPTDWLEGLPGPLDPL